MKTLRTIFALTLVVVMSAAITTPVFARRGGGWGGPMMNLSTTQFYNEAGVPIPAQPGFGGPGAWGGGFGGGCWYIDAQGNVASRWGTDAAGNPIWGPGGGPGVCWRWNATGGW